MEYIISFPKIEHLEQLVQLNRKFLINNLSPEQREKGFIRIKYSKEDFERIITNQEIVVAFNFEDVVAYYMIGRISSTKKLDYQKNIAKKVAEKFNYIEDRIGYGCQVCIDKDFRHYGLFKNMLIALTSKLDTKYDFLLCSISDNNIASLKAHKKNGWEFVDKNETTNFFLYDILKNRENII